MRVEVREEQALPEGLDRLLQVAHAEGFPFVERFVDEWERGENRFDRAGEAALFAWCNGFLVGFGGLNRDPYLEDVAVGRVRHVYVAPAARGRGVGSALVAGIVRRARPTFARLRLRTRDAGAFYEKLGFRPVDEPDATHALELGAEAVTVRRMAAEELPRLGEIDRSEHVTGEYVHRDGVLERRPADLRVATWAAAGEGSDDVPGRVAAWRPILERGGTLLGAFAGEALVGLAIYRPRLAEDMGNLAVLYVSRAHRRRGVASRLGDEVARLARRDGARRLYVSATPSDSAVGFYLGRGFEPVAEPDPELFALEPDDIHMVLAL